VGNYVEFAFTGTNVGIYGHKGLGHGRLNVSVDGGPPVMVECYLPVERYRMPLYQVSGLANTTHTIRATIIAKNPVSSYRSIGIDYFQQDPGTPPSSPVTSIWDNPANASTVYTGTWSFGTGDLAYYAGTMSNSATVGSYVDFTFTGTGVGLYGTKDSNLGKLSVQIDGGPSTLINCYQPVDPDYLVRLYGINGLAPGTHTLRATVATQDPASTGNTVRIDYFQILNGTGMTSVAPVVDTYVRNGTYANTNFGTSTVMEVKNGGSSYDRNAFLRFNVAGFTNASKALLQITPTIVNTDPVVTYTVELVTSDTWSETGMTWNNKPAGSGVILGQFTGAQMQANVPMTVDITNGVRNQAAGDGVLSIRIYSNNFGEFKNFTCSSREDAATSKRPQLLIQ
jgi:hypothetical protein